MAMGGPYYHVRGEPGNRPKDCYPEHDTFDNGGPCRPCFKWARGEWLRQQAKHRNIPVARGALVASAFLAAALPARWLLYPGAPEPFGSVWAVCSGLVAGGLGVAVVKHEMKAKGAS